MHNIEKSHPVESSILQNLESIVSHLRSEIVQREHDQKVLQQAKFSAEKSAEAKSIFLANMSHEIRTPLGLILGFAEELVNSSQLTPDNRYLILTIQRNSEMLARLINDILDFSKVEAGQMEFAVGSINCCHLLDEIEVLLKAKCTEKNLYYQKDILTSLPQYFYSDEVRIKQVLQNVICNAVKNTDAGGITIKVSYSQAHSLLSFDVIDSGAGIPIGRQADIFQVFKQLHKDKPGSGLGLPLSRDLARGLKGDLKLVRSQPGEGSWFRAEIKNQIAFHQGDHATHAIDVARSPCPPNLTGWNVLVVDDLIDNVRLLKCILGPTQASVDMTTSSQQALEKIKTVNYDLILLDLIMPEMNGFKTLEKLREQGFSGKVWAVSAHAMPKDIRHCLDAGFEQHISKPIQRMDFYQRLQTLLHQ